MDECKHCTVRGDLKRCLETKCNQHESWMVKELKRVYQNEIVQQGMLLDAIENAAEGKPVSDFEQSFPIVRAVIDKGWQNYCHTCKEPMSNDCPNCERLWAS